MRLLPNPPFSLRTSIAGVVGAVSLLAAVALGTAGVSSQSGLTVAVDADIEGNAPRAVWTVERCVSADVGETLEIDVVVIAPGIPGDRGISGYEFQFFFDPAVIRLLEEDKDQLLAQATGSNVLPFFNDPLPNDSGEYGTVAVDFGSSGIEPNGSSEVGPGVVSRLRVEVVGEGVSPLGLRDVDLRGDDEKPLTLLPVHVSVLAAGEPCPELTPPPPTAPTTSPTPTPPPTPAPTPAATNQPPAANLSGGPDSGAGTLAAGGDVPAGSVIALAMGFGLAAGGLIWLVTGRRRWIDTNL